MAEIKCSKGVVLVDDADLEMLMSYSGWYIVTKDGKSYAARSQYDRETRKSKRVYMHRLLVPGHSQVDHIDGDGLNNQR